MIKEKKKKKQEPNENSHEITFPRDRRENIHPAFPTVCSFNRYTYAVFYRDDDANI